MSSFVFSRICLKMLLVVICLVTRANALTEIDPHDAEPHNAEPHEDEPHDVEPRWGEPHPRGMVKEWTNDPPPIRLSSYHALWHTLNTKQCTFFKIHTLDWPLRLKLKLDPNLKLALESPYNNNFTTRLLWLKLFWILKRSCGLIFPNCTIVGNELRQASDQIIPFAQFANNIR